jgi:hypothetical protein
MSDVARFREQQALEAESAYLGMYGSAIVGNHDSIIARMEQGAVDIIALFEAGKGEEALELWESGILEK